MAYSPVESANLVTTFEIIALTAAAAAAGMVNAIAGGGTLITFPVLLFFKTPEKVANATSTLALVLGMAGSLFGYRNHLAAVRSWLWRFIPVSVIGGFVGSVLLTRTDDAVFAKMVPFLILFATLLFLAQGTFRKLSGFSNGTPSPGPRHHAVWVAILVQIGVAVYGGYFGAGIGILMLASLGFIGLSNIHEMNSLKTILAALINIVASAWFVASGLIDWPKATTMTAGALGGYYLGAHFAQRIPQHQVRRLINAIGLTISALMFYKQFAK